MNDDMSFALAMALRESHCDRDVKHDCVGEVTIKRGEVCLNCTLCGKGSHFPGWDSAVNDLLKKIFEIVGIEWEAIAFDKRMMAIRAYKKLAEHGPEEWK